MDHGGIALLVSPELQANGQHELSHLCAHEQLLCICSSRFDNLLLVIDELLDPIDDLLQWCSALFRNRTLILKSLIVLGHGLVSCLLDGVEMMHQLKHLLWYTLLVLEVEADGLDDEQEHDAIASTGDCRKLGVRLHSSDQCLHALTDNKCIQLLDLFLNLSLLPSHFSELSLPNVAIS